MNNIDVNQPAKGEATPLFIASGTGHKDIVELLLDMKNIDVNKPEKETEMNQTHAEPRYVNSIPLNLKYIYPLSNASLIYTLYSTVVIFQQYKI